MSNFIEVEIHHLLSQNLEVKQVARQLIDQLDTQPEQLTPENINSLSNFLINANLNFTLINYVLQSIENPDFKIPWPYYLDALANTNVELDKRFMKAVRLGIRESGAELSASRSSKLDLFLPELQEWRNEYRYGLYKKHRTEKEMLLDQLILLRTQQLFQREKELLQQLQKLYPSDKDIIQEANEYRQRNALEILQKRSPKKNTALQEKAFDAHDPEVESILKNIENSMIEFAEQDPEMAFDFAVAAFMLEDYELALNLLNYTIPSTALYWLRMEILLRNRHFVELLSAIAHVEIQFAHDSETFFATAYYRAQALWGLGQKHAAMEVMRGLIAARPNYRSADALLNIWSDQ